MPWLRRDEWHGNRRRALVGCTVAGRVEPCAVGRVRLTMLGFQSFGADAAGRIIHTGPPRSWWDEAGAPPPPQLAASMRRAFPDLRVTGLCDLEAELIMTDRLIVTFDAAILRPAIAGRLPRMEGARWLDVPRTGGFPGEPTLAALLAREGWEDPAGDPIRKASAVMHLLDGPPVDGRAVLAHLLGQADRPS